MIKEVKYSGLSNVPGDYDCADGELAASIDLTVENGEVKPFVRPEPFMSINGELLGVHRGGDYENFITIDNKYLYTQTRSSERTQIASYDGNIIKIETLGNTIIVISDTNPLRYLLFKDGTYINLGEKPTFPIISFGLRGTIVKDKVQTVNIDPVNQVVIYGEFSPNNRKRVSDAIIPLANAYIQRESKDKGRFIFPFFVRYAYRLYDGSLFMHSAPILMLPSTEVAPQGIITLIHSPDPDRNPVTGYDIRLQTFVCELDYGTINSDQIKSTLADWADIVKSIDVFISAPIITYDQNGQCQGVEKNDRSTYPHYGILCVDDKTDPGSGEYLYYKRTMYNIESTFSYSIIMPSKKQDVVRDEIASNGLFYKIASIYGESISLSRKKIELKENILNSLQLQERMTDDYNSHNLISAKSGYTYNSRLNIASVKQKLYEGFPTESLCCRTYSGISNSKYEVYTCIQEDGREIVMKNESRQNVYEPFGIFLYYPSTNAYKMYVLRFTSYDTKEWAEFKLSPHGSLNGAYCFSGFDAIEWKDIREVPMPEIIVTQESVVSSPNKLFTSELNNPFVFPVSGINTIGTGEIRSIASATKALSQGQFGQFPLYVFSSEGIWAMEISDTGTYSSRQMVARDVINNPLSILQLDGALAFTSDRGVMLLQGSDVICISGNQDGPTFRITDLNSYEKIIDVIANESIANVLGNTIPLKDYLTGAFMSYDYPNSRIIIINPGYAYAYVYSISSNTWTTITSDYVRSVNNYPDSYLTSKNGDVVNISEVISDDEPTIVKGILISRPLKLDIPDVLKTINTIAHRGKFNVLNVGSIIYASRNGEQYIPIASSNGKFIRRVHGSPYNYYRIVLIVEMLKKEGVSGLTVDFEPKYMNKLR